MTPIQIIAFIFALVAGIKILIILISPRTWYNNVVKPVWKNPTLVMIISLLLAALTLYYLLQEITIIQIFATMLFLAMLIAIGVAVYQKEVIELATKLLKDKALVKKSWFYILIWIILIVWVLNALFM